MKGVIKFLIISCLSNVFCEKLVPIKNGWSVAHPCKDNKKITILVDNQELTKSEFKFHLSIQGFATESRTVTLLRESDYNSKKNDNNFVKDEFQLQPGQKSIYKDLEGHNGKISKFKSLTIDGINICNEPDDEIIINSSYQNENTEPSPPKNKQPVIIESEDDDGDDDDYPQVFKKSNLSPYIDSKSEDYCGVRKIMHIGLISRGYSSKPGDWPWHVALFRYHLNWISRSYICGGTLISKILVLTAGHCVTDSGSPIIPDSLVVVLGKYKLIAGGENTQEKRVFKIIVHEAFEHSTIEYDIALLKLESEAKYTDYVQPACLWRTDYYTKLPSKHNITGMVVGWGYNSSTILAEELQQTSLPKVSFKTCSRKNVYFAKAIKEYNFCAGHANGTSVCNGDSGGGYHVFLPNNQENSSSKEGKWYVYGIVSKAVAINSGGQSVCDPYQYVIFTKVEAFSAWIEQYLID